MTESESLLLRKLDLQSMFNSEKTDSEILIDLVMLCPYFKGGVEGIDWNNLLQLKQNYLRILIQYHGQQQNITKGLVPREIEEILIHLADLCTEFLYLMHTLQLI